MTRKNPKRKKRTRHPVKMRLATVKGDARRQMQLYAQADRHALLGDHELAAGTWQHSRTGLWQVWMSTAGGDITWLSAHRERGEAEWAVAAFRDFAQTEGIFDPDLCATFCEKLAEHGDAEPEPMNAQEILAITTHIRERVFALGRRTSHEQSG